MSYHLKKLGIGDLLLFCLEMKQTGIKSLTISFDKGILNTYRSDTPNYSIFCKELLIFLLPEVDITFSESIGNIHYNENWTVIDNSLKNEKVLNSFHKIYGRDKIEDYIVLTTKIRDFHYNNFTNLSKTFFDKVNKLKRKVYLLGEREVEYGTEYQILSEKRVYSIYNQIIKNIDSDLIIDKTIPKLGITTPKLELLKQDLSILTNSHKTLMFGRGGLFCISLITGNLCSFHNEPYVNVIPSQLNKQVFTNVDMFLNNI